MAELFSSLFEEDKPIVRRSGGTAEEVDCRSCEELDSSLTATIARCGSKFFVSGPSRSENYNPDGKSFVIEMASPSILHMKDFQVVLVVRG